MIIETDNLRKEYQSKVAVKGISIKVEEGQVYGFLGPNGAGKSTFIKMLTGLVHPTSGIGAVLGYPLGDIRARAGMGYLPELFRYQPWMSGEDLLNFHSGLYRLKKCPARNKEVWMSGEDLLNFHSGLYRLKKCPARNKEVLERVGLLGHEKYKVGSYSKGMQQRIGLACALLARPKLLFLDEPTSALDPVGRKEVRDVILSIKNEGHTVFLNSHLLSEVEAVSDSITIIHQGEVVKFGTMNELLEEKTELAVRAKDIPESFLQNNSFGALRQTDGSILFTNIKKEDIPDIAAKLVQCGAKIYELTPRHETLESIFLKVVGEEGEKPS